MYLVNEEIQNIDSILNKGVYRGLLICDWHESHNDYDEIYKYLNLPNDLSFTPQKVHEYHLSLKTVTSKKVLLKLFKRVKSYEDEQDTIFSWIFTFVFNAYYDFLIDYKNTLNNQYSIKEDIIDNKYIGDLDELIKRVESKYNIAQSKDESIPTDNYVETSQKVTMELGDGIELFDLTYGEKNDQVMRLLYSTFKSEFSDISWEDFRGHFLPSKRKLNKIIWKSTQPNIVGLFSKLKFSNKNLYKLLETHFYDGKNNKSYSNKQLGVVYQKSNKLNNKTIEFLEAVEDITKSNTKY